jgi:hypothetical protein
MPKDSKGNYIPQSKKRKDYTPQSKRMSYDDWKSMGGKEKQRRKDRGEFDDDTPSPRGKLKLSGEEMLKRGGRIRDMFKEQYD